MFSILCLLQAQPLEALRSTPHILEHTTSTTTQIHHFGEGDASHSEEDDASHSGEEDLHDGESDDKVLKSIKVVSSDDHSDSTGGEHDAVTASDSAEYILPSKTFVSKVSTTSKTVYSLSSDLGSAAGAAHQSLIMSHSNALSAANSGTCSAWSHQSESYSDEASKIKAFAKMVSSALTAAAQRLQEEADGSAKQRIAEETADKAITDGTSQLAAAADLGTRSALLTKTAEFELPVIGYLQQFEGSKALLTEFSNAQAELAAIDKLYDDLLQAITGIYQGSSSADTEFKCPAAHEADQQEDSPSDASPATSGAQMMAHAAEMQMHVLAGIQVRDSLKLQNAMAAKSAAVGASLKEIGEKVKALANDQDLFAQIEAMLKDVPAELLAEKLEALKKEATLSDMKEVLEHFSAVISLELSNPPLKDFLKDIFN